MKVQNGRTVCWKQLSTEERDELVNLEDTNSHEKSKWKRHLLRDFSNGQKRGGGGATSKNLRTTVSQISNILLFDSYSEIGNNNKLLQKTDC